MTLDTALHLIIDFLRHLKESPPEDMHEATLIAAAIIGEVGRVGPIVVAEALQERIDKVAKEMNKEAN